MQDVYLWVKFLHVLATVVLAGWVFMAPLWIGHSLRHLEPAACTTFRRRVTVLTVLAVAGAGALLWLTGVLMARVLSPEAFTLHWLKAGTVSFVATVLLWLFVALPLYRHLLGTRATGSAVTGLPRHLATITACAAVAATLFTLWMMVVRPA